MGTGAGATGVTFTERLQVPLWWHLGAVGLAALLGGYFAAYAHGALARGIVWAGALVLVEGLLLSLGRAGAQVGGGVLRAGGRQLPVDAIRGAEAVTDVRTVLNPYAYAVTRAWVPTGVRIGTRDETWVLSTRRPAELVAALSQAA